MISSLPLYLASATPKVFPPLFGDKWLALAAILAGVAVLMAVVAGVGHWLAATHPDAPTKLPVAPKSSGTSVAASGLSPETLAIIAASVTVVLGEHTRIAAIRPIAPSVEMLMQQWSLEGRRQIYSSHQVR
jgi:hypothetical protein